MIWSRDKIGTYSHLSKILQSQPLHFFLKDRQGATYLSSQKGIWSIAAMMTTHWSWSPCAGHAPTCLRLIEVWMPERFSPFQILLFSRCSLNTVCTKDTSSKCCSYFTKQRSPCSTRTWICWKHGGTSSKTCISKITSETRMKNSHGINLEP